MAVRKRTRRVTGAVVATAALALSGPASAGPVAQTPYLAGSVAGSGPGSLPGSGAGSVAGSATGSLAGSAISIGGTVGGLVAMSLGLAPSAPDYPTELLVEAPRGELGPRTTTAVDPATVPGIRNVGERWIIEGGVAFDETAAGGHLEFDAPVLVVGPGVTIDGARFVDVNITEGRSHVLSSERPEYGFVARHVEFVGGSGASAIGGPGEDTVVENFSIIDFDGDGVKPASGWTVSDGRIHIRGVPTSAKHYDGVQVTGQNGVTLSRLEISMVGGGTAAVFVHDGQRGRTPNTVHDIVVIHAPEVFRTLRFDDTVVARSLQGMGPVVSARQPAAFVLAHPRADIDWTSVHSTFESPVPVAD